MATILREASFAPYQVRRYFPQVDPVPNLLLALTRVAPFRSNESLLNRVEPRKWAQDFQQPNFQTQGIPVPAVDPRIFRTPLISPIFPRRYVMPEQVVNPTITLYKIAAAVPPFTMEQFPEVYRKPWGDILGGEYQSFLPGPASLPYFPVEFPTPMRARANPQDFFFQTTGIQPAAPFNQDDWPEIYRKRYIHQSFEWSGATTRGIPTGINAPFSQNEWPISYRPKQTFHEVPPNTTLKGLPQAFPFFQDEWVTPIRARQVPSDSYSSPEIVLTTVVPKPFAQTDWPPLPTRARSTPQSDFYFEAWNTFYRPTVPSGTIAMPNLIGINFYEAAEILQALGIYIPKTIYFAQSSQITIKWARSNQYRGGIVIAQSIASGNLTSRGAPITLTLASFPFASLIDLPPDWKQLI